MQSCLGSLTVLLYRRQLTLQSEAERGFKGKYMTAALFDVDGICTTVCILKGSKANSFNVCLLALTLFRSICVHPTVVQLLNVSFLSP